MPRGAPRGMGNYLENDLLCGGRHHLKADAIPQALQAPCELGHEVVVPAFIKIVGPQSR
jgi:hypothetical protein